MTVPTTGPCSVPALLALARDDVQQLVAVDDAAEVIDHHQTIAVAIERDAGLRRTPGTVSCSSSGDVEPQFRLMLRPFGEQPIGTISAPRSARMRGADFVAGAVRAIDHDLEAASGPGPARSTRRTPGSARATCRRASRARARSTRASPAARRGAARSAPRSRRRACRRCASKNLMPLSSYRLCEALMTTPKSHSKRLRQIGDARRRQRTDQHDVHARRDEARFERGLEHVAGQAACPCRRAPCRRSAPARAPPRWRGAARSPPSADARRRVPRTPSVPKYLRAHRSLSRCRYPAAAQRDGDFDCIDRLRDVVRAQICSRRPAPLRSPRRRRRPGARRPRGPAACRTSICATRRPAAASPVAASAGKCGEQARDYAQAACRSRCPDRSTMRSRAMPAARQAATRSRRKSRTSATTSA